MSSSSGSRSTKPKPKSRATKPKDPDQTTVQLTTDLTNHIVLFRLLPRRCKPSSTTNPVSWRDFCKIVPNRPKRNDGANKGAKPKRDGKWILYADTNDQLAYAMLQETYGGIDRLSDAQIDEWRVKDSYFHPKSSRLGRDEWRAEVKRVLREECCLPTKVDLGDRKMYPYWYLVDLKSKEGGGDGDQDEEWEDVDGEDDEQEEEMAGSGPGGLESTPNRRQEPELEDSARSETSGSQPNSESSESVILPPPGYTLGRYAPWWADPAVLPPQEAAKGTTHPNLIKMTAWDINAWTKYNPDVFCDRETGYNDISTRARLHAKFNGTFMNQTEQDCKFWIKDGAAFDDKAEKYADWSTDDVKTHLDFYYGVGNYEDDGTDPSDDDDEGSLYSWPKRTGPGVGQGQENRAEEIEDGDDVDTGDLCYKSYHETTDAEDHFDHDVEMEDVEQAGGSSTKSNKTSTRKRVASDEEPEASPKRRKLS